MKSSLFIALIICLCISSLPVEALNDKSVLFLTSSGRDLGVNSTSVSEGQLTFSQNLQSAGYKVEEKEYLTAEILSKCSVLVVHDAAFYSSSYTSLIKDFINAGGGLLIFSEGINYPAFDELTQQFGVKINKNSVYQNGYVIEISTFSEHEIFKDIKMLRAQFSSVVAQSPAKAVAQANPDSYTTGDEKTFGPSPPVIAVSQLGKGKVIIIGSHHIFRNYDIQSRDNLKFGLNCIEWLSTPYTVPTATPTPTATSTPTATPTATPTTAPTATATATPTRPAPGFEAITGGIVLIAVALLAMRKR